MKKVEIVIGANYGDEGKGLLTRHFAVEAKRSKKSSIIVLHNGTAQRGHTVDYNAHSRHIYHHFGSGTADGVPTFYTSTYWVHPMEFVREYVELATQMKVFPTAFCDKNAPVITPFDMLADHITMDWLARKYGEREYGTCGFGSWCAVEDSDGLVAPIGLYAASTDEQIKSLLEKAWERCMSVLMLRGVDIATMPEYKEYVTPNSVKWINTISHFIDDVRFFLSHVRLTDFDSIYEKTDTIIFENGQGLGLDKNVGDMWHTTSNTGLTNPVEMLKDKDDFTAEVCYVTRSYLTRHGKGSLEEEVAKKEINADMLDKTNIPNDFQGALRYGYLEDKAQAERIERDWRLVKGDKRFTKEMAITHCNEFEDLFKKAKYYSDSPYEVRKR